MERRLAAILAADVVGYTRLMGEDEMGTLQRLTALRQGILEPLIAKHHGRVVKLIGDGLLVEFASLVDAVDCAVAWQTAVEEHEVERPEEDRLYFRIGVNLGDVLVEGEDIHGDGVNIAARLEGLADPGGICLSGDAYRQVRGKVEVDFEDLGEREVKNVAEPLRVYRIATARRSPIAASMVAKPPPVPNKPSIAVLPFTNMSGDPDQQYFADGISEDLITSLSRFPWLFVISRNSSFTYKDKSVHVKQVSEDLDVRYLVEGSVRKSDTRIRVTAQLIDAVNDQHVWAETYDRPVGDLFDLQDDITQTITGVLVPALSNAERKRWSRNSRPSLDAWEAYQRALAYYYRPYNEEDHAEARRLFDQAIELDSSLADAHVMVAMMGVYAVNTGQSSYSGSREEILTEAARSAERAVQLEDNNALAHTALGRVRGLSGDQEVGIVECRTAVDLNPNLATAHHELGFSLTMSAQFAEAILCFEKAIRLSPNDPSRWNFYLLKADALFYSGECEDAIINVKEAIRLRPTAFWPYFTLASSLVELGRMEEAHAAVQQALARKPDITVTLVSDITKSFPSEYLEIYLENLRKAGLPE
jgi:TolB-like protein/Flp pilus assembly protein TadD